MPFVPNWIPDEDRETIRRGFAAQIAIIGLVVCACLFRVLFVRA